MVSPKGYLRTIFLRYLRLSPLYFILMFFGWKIAPTLTSGPFSDWSNQASCQDTWFYNVLYLNNWLPGKENLYW